MDIKGLGMRPNLMDSSCLPISATPHIPFHAKRMHTQSLQSDWSVTQSIAGYTRQRGRCFFLFWWASVMDMDIMTLI